jgi:hypothetical protein
MACEQNPIAKMRAPARLPFCVCVPARDEAERLPRLLDALAGQDIEGPIAVALCLNNCSDGSEVAVAAAKARHAGRLSITLDVCVFPPDLAHAGSARASAMALGLACLGQDNGVLITTDADARPPPEWLAANLDAIRSGADIVGGRLLMDEEEPIAPALVEARALWDLYWAEVRRIEDEVDPLPWDRPPRHGDHTGGSLALTSEIYRRSGGVPRVACGEDRLLVEAAIEAGGRLVHPVSVWTRVSPRSDGKAAGGMADMMKRMTDAATRGFFMAPSLRHWQERARWRRQLRAETGDAGRLTRAERALPPMPHDMRLDEIGGRP